MKLLKCILTENDCYKSKRTIKPEGVMVHSTGADNPNLRRSCYPPWELTPTATIGTARALTCASTASLDGWRTAR